MPSPNLCAMLFDLGTISDRPAEVALKPSEAERAAIARWLGIMAVESLAAIVRVWRSQTDRYAYAASFEADVVQACVVTLEPVRSHLAGEFSRRLLIVPRQVGRAQAAESNEVLSADDDELEVLSSPFFDLAAPVLEELSLALDPYPRAEGAVFEVREQREPAVASPFAMLETLKPQAQAPGRRTSENAAPMGPSPAGKSGKRAARKAKTRGR
jgi:uncharacterized metal-binding protein YceD (DUF177 family)